MPKIRSEYIYSTTMTFTRNTGSIRSKVAAFPIVQYPEDNTKNAYVYNILKVHSMSHEKYLRTVTRRMLGIKRIVSMSDDPIHGVFAINVLTLSKPRGKQKAVILNYLAKIAEDRIGMYSHVAKSAREAAKKFAKIKKHKTYKELKE